MTIKAIETVYNGYRFRSRTEARWAVFFDTLKISYKYETEGYNLDGLWYLPDFWLPNNDCWIEVKGKEPDEEEVEKAGRMAALHKKPLYIFWGDVWNDVSVWKFERKVTPLKYSKYIDLVIANGDYIIALEMMTLWPEWYWGGKIDLAFELLKYIPGSEVEYIEQDMKRIVEERLLESKVLYTLKKNMSIKLCERCHDLRIGVENQSLCDCFGNVTEDHPDLIQAFTAARQARF